MFNKSDLSGYLNPLEGIQQKTLVYGQKTLMTKFLLKAGSDLPRHQHPYEQTGYLVEGKLRLFIGDSEFSAEAGDSWCIAENVEHGAKVIEDSMAIEIFSPVRKEYIP